MRARRVGERIMRTAALSGFLFPIRDAYLIAAKVEPTLKKLTRNLLFIYCGDTKIDLNQITTGCGVRSMCGICTPIDINKYDFFSCKKSLLSYKIQ